MSLDMKIFLSKPILCVCIFSVKTSCEDTFVPHWNNWWIFNFGHLQFHGAHFTPALSGVRANLGTGGIRAGVNGAGGRKGPAVKGPIRYDDKKPRHMWKIGRVDELIRSKDGIVRAAKVQTGQGPILSTPLRHSPKQTRPKQNPKQKSCQKRHPKQK